MLGRVPVTLERRSMRVHHADRRGRRASTAEFTRLVARARDPLTPLRDRFQAWADKKAA